MALATRSPQFQTGFQQAPSVYPYESLEEVLKGLVLVMDAALRIKEVEKPQGYNEWVGAAGEALLLGRGWNMSVEQQRAASAASFMKLMNKV